MAGRAAEEESRRKTEAHRKKILSGKVKLPDGHILEMVQIEPGTFTMGSPAGREENTFLWFIFYLFIFAAFIVPSGFIYFLPRGI